LDRAFRLLLLSLLVDATSRLNSGGFSLMGRYVLTLECTFNRLSLSNVYVSPFHIRTKYMVHPNHNQDEYELVIHLGLDPKDFRAFPK